MLNTPQREELSMFDTKMCFVKLLRLSKLEQSNKWKLILIMNPHEEEFANMMIVQSKYLEEMENHFLSEDAVYRDCKLQEFQEKFNNSK